MSLIRSLRPNLPVALQLLFAAIVALIVAQVVQFVGIPSTFAGLPLAVLLNVLVFVLSLGALFITYVYALYSVKESEYGRLKWLVLAITAALMVPVVANPGLLSHDVYGYIFYGRMENIYRLNPYVVRPSAVPGDPFLAYVDWRDMVSPYGPLWTTWSALLDAITQGGIVAHVTAFKISAGLTHLANTLLVGLIMERISKRHTAAAMAAYGWNPLALFEFAGNAHNEFLMVFWILLSLLAYFRRKPALAIVLLALAVSTKFTAILFTPFYALAFFRIYQDRRQLVFQLAKAGALGVVTWIACWGPYIPGGGWRQMLSLPEPSNWYMNSLPSAAYALVRDVILTFWSIPPVNAASIADKLVTILSLSLVICIGIKLAIRMKQKGNLLEMCFWFGFSYIVLAASYFQPWYVTALIPFAVLSRKAYIFALATGLSMGGMFMYSCTSCHTYLPNRTDFSLVGLAVFVIPLLMLGIFVLRRNSLVSLFERAEKIG